MPTMVWLMWILIVIPCRPLPPSRNYYLFPYALLAKFSFGLLWFPYPLSAPKINPVGISNPFKRVGHFKTNNNWPLLNIIMIPFNTLVHFKLQPNAGGAAAGRACQTSTHSWALR